MEWSCGITLNHTLFILVMPLIDQRLRVTIIPSLEIAFSPPELSCFQFQSTCCRLIVLYLLIHQNVGLKVDPGSLFFNSPTVQIGSKFSI